MKIRMMLCFHQRMKKVQAGHKVIQRPGLVEKSRFTLDHQFRYPGDRRSHYDFCPRHRFHQHQWDSLAAARQDDKVGPVVKGIHLLPWHVAQERYSLLKTAIPNQRLQVAPFWSLARDGALQPHTARLKLLAGSKQKGMVLHRVEPSHRQQLERIPTTHWPNGRAIRHRHP